VVAGSDDVPGFKAFSVGRRLGLGATSLACLAALDVAGWVALALLPLGLLTSDPQWLARLRGLAKRCLQLEALVGAGFEASVLYGQYWVLDASGYRFAQEKDKARFVFALITYVFSAATIPLTCLFLPLLALVILTFRSRRLNAKLAARAAWPEPAGGADDFKRLMQQGLERPESMDVKKP
jgi:hypothetical protein